MFISSFNGNTLGVSNPLTLKLVLPNAVYKCHTPPVSGGGVGQVYKGQ